MHHFFDALQNTTGDAQPGYFARVLDSNTQAVVPIYADDNGTPIIAVSGVADMAKSDSLGNLDFYVAPGTYFLDIYAPDALTPKRRIANVAMNSEKGDTGPAGPLGGVGPPGASNNTRVNLAALKAAATSDVTSLYDQAVWTWTLGNYTGLADDVNIVASNSTALSVGAWVRQSLSGLVPNFKRIDPPNTPLTATASGTSGNPNGTYYYRFTYVDAQGNETDPSQSSNSVVAAGEQINLTDIAVGPIGTVARKVYRTRADAVDAVVVKLLTTINNNTATSFTDNVADGSLGADASYFNSTGGDITINDEPFLTSSASSLSMGVRAGRSGYASTYYGLAAGEDVTSGFRLTAVGVEALQKVTTGYEMTAVGVHALGNTTTARWNNAFGYGALQSLTTAESCNAFGHRALVSVTTGARNDGFGSAAGILLSTGGDNALFGFEAGWALTTGNGNTVVGSQAGHLIGAGNFNSIFGYLAGVSVTGSANVLFGFNAGQRLTTGGSNILIGPNAGVWLTTQNSRLFIDNQGRTDLADAEAKALVTGEFSTTPALQWVRINGVLSVNESIQIAGTKVIGPRGAAVANPTGGVTVDAECRAQLALALAALRTHGLIAP